jgi:hypothetical protein
VNPDPVTVAALTVTVPVPEDVIVTVCVAGVLRSTVPKLTLLDPRVKVGVVAFSVSAKVFAIPPPAAVNVAV